MMQFRQWWQCYQQSWQQSWQDCWQYWHCWQSWQCGWYWQCWQWWQYLKAPMGQSEVISDSSWQNLEKYESLLNIALRDASASKHDLSGIPVACTRHRWHSNSLPGASRAPPHLGTAKHCLFTGQEEDCTRMVFWRYIILIDILPRTMASPM